MTYPSSLDELTDGVPSDGAAPTTALDNATYPHDDHHRALGVAVEAIEAELGTNPKGGSADVKTRIAATETVANAAAAKASNLSDLTSASSARTNLGLGGAATLSVGTTAGTVAAGDDSRITGAVPKSTVTTAGDLIYGTGNAAVSRLGIGTALQVLRTNAGATAPEWATVSSGAVSVIARTVLGSDTATVDFTSIPATYENLAISYVVRATSSSTWVRLLMRCNNDSAANYESALYYQASGSENSTAQTAARVAVIPDASATAGWAASGQVDIAGYARTVFKKSVMSDYGAQYAVGTGGQLAGIGQSVWVSSSAINQLTFLSSEGNLLAGSVFTLYGIAGA